jgi:hypothetical protein
VSLPHIELKDRPPPPPPTPLTFPCYQPEVDGPDLDERTDVDLMKLFISIKAYTDITATHVSAFNLHVNREVALDQLIPAHHIPPLEWATSSSPHSAVSSEVRGEFKVLGNGKPAPGCKAYQALVKEILFDADKVYKSLSNLDIPSDPNPVRVSHFRRFYQELRNIADYWDTSSDNSYATRDGKPVPPPTPATDNLLASDDNKPATVYIGHRTSSGDKMPVEYRDKVVRELVEPIIWQFGCRSDAPRAQLPLNIQTLRIPIGLAGLAYRTPVERPQSIAGTLEGPLTGVQTRSQTRFDPDDVAVHRLDLLREVGAMLLIAQMRAREGTEELIAGLDKWYVTRPRWGGGTGLAIGTPLGVASEEDAAIAAQSESSSNQGSEEQSEEPPKKMRKEEKLVRVAKMKEARRREDVRRSTLPPTSKWDKRVKYMHIGKGDNDEFDTVSIKTNSHYQLFLLSPRAASNLSPRQIYLISSVNHHISLLRILVHPKYLEWLAKGGKAVGEPWHKLQMDRTRWYDLFIPEDRKDVIRGVWGILSYLTGAH